MFSKALLAKACLMALFAFASSISLAQQDSGPLVHLPGRWVGQAVVIMTNGEKENMKCNSNYTVEGTNVSQVLRCASPSNAITLKSRLTVNGQNIRGQWEEEKNSVQGQASGRMAQAGFDLNIQSEFFNARMALRTEARKQTVDIVPRDSDVKRILITLSK